MICEDDCRTIIYFQDVLHVDIIVADEGHAWSGHLLNGFILVYMIFKNKKLVSASIDTLSQSQINIGLKTSGRLGDKGNFNGFKK